MSGARAQLLAAWKQASARHASLLAAGVAFYVFLSLFPGIIAVLLTYGLVVSAETLDRQSAQIVEALPADAASLITGQMQALAETSSGSLGLGLLVAVTLALYSASGGVTNLVTAINAMFGFTETRNFVQRKLLALVLTIGAITFLVVTVTLVAVAPAAFNSLIDSPGMRLLAEAVRWTLLLGAVVLGVAALFRLAPDRGEVESPALLSRGVVVAAMMWAAVSVGFSLYVDNFGSYGKTYGALAGVVVLLLWLWAGLFAMLLGASIEALREDAPTDDLPADLAEEVAQA